MSLLSIPDIAGMLIMMGVLLWLRREYRDTRVDLWMIGLFFILVEAIAVAVFRGSKVQSSAAHLVALDAYVLAAVTFGWAARRDLLPGTRRVPLFVLPAAPLFVITTIYGLNVTNLAVYRNVAVLGLAVGGGYLLFLARRSVRFRVMLLIIHLLIWAPMIVLSNYDQIRWLVYWGLTCMYLLVAASFRGLIRRDRVGGVVIVAGFAFWAMCFLVHPLVRGVAPYDGIVEQLWNMQKFFVILGMVLVLLEEQTRRRQEEAMHDPLTALPNLRLFDDRLTQALERTRRTGLSAALFAMDLDNFKQVNDTHGHMTGDAVLIKVANGLKGVVRSSDTLARRGGDEFWVIVNDLARREDCERIVMALREAIEAVELPQRRVDQLSVSVGYAIFPEDAQDAVSLCELADLNMYAEKTRGRRVPVPA